MGRIRRGIVLSLLSAVVLTCCSGLASAEAAAPNPIQIENAKPGTTAWESPASPSTAIQGYASGMSVQPGDVLQLHVSAEGDARYRIEIYRLGWYGGDGGRRIACIPSCTADEAGTQWTVPQPDAATGELDAGWPITDRITVGSDWTSGYYIARLDLTSGPDAGQASTVFFVVRAPAGANPPVLLQVPVNTWEAYNSWGGKSLYSSNSTDDVAATMVSFNRPFVEQGGGWGSDIALLDYEYPLVRFLEREGYDVSYQTDVDTDENPNSLLAHRLDIVAGHDEYWSGAIRSALDQARDSGINLAFIGADIGYWQLRYADSDTTLVEYRTGKADPDPNPSEKTVAFRNLNPPMPECELLGIGFDAGEGVNAGSGNYTVEPAATSNSWFVGTSLAPGDEFPNSIGYEWDDIEPGCDVPPLQDLLHGEANGYAADAVTYQAPSGARVFSDGTLNLTWTLDGGYNFDGAPRTDARVQRLFSNIFDDLGGGAPGTNPEPDAPQLESPKDRATVATRVAFRWSSPAAAEYDRYVVVIDGRPAASLSASSCAGEACAVTLRVRPGQHSWLVEGSDSLGNSMTSVQSGFSATGPTVALLSPRAHAELWSPAPTLLWRLKYSAGARVRRYVIQIDSTRINIGRHTRLSLARLLRDGWHHWSVEAILSHGRRWSGTAAFQVASVRITPASTRSWLRRGLRFKVWCPRRCLIDARLGFGLRVAAQLGTVRVARRGNLADTAIRFTGQARTRLAHAQGRLVILTVLATASRGYTHRVSVTFRWGERPQHRLAESSSLTILLKDVPRWTSSLIWG
jgi:hypothetical protein